MSQPKGTIRKPFLDRFWSKIHKSSAITSCWIWTGGNDGNGYGQIYKDVDHGMVKPHRVMWELTHGPIPENSNILHTCNLGLCVNPDHLFLGVHPRSVFTEEVIGKIRQIFDTEKESSTKSEVIQRLATQYNVSFSTISKIVYRQRWRHIP